MNTIKRRRGRKRLPPSAKRSEELRLYLTPGEMRLVLSSASKGREDYRDWAKRAIMSAASA
jgi:hypothetical protein